MQSELTAAPPKKAGASLPLPVGKLLNQNQVLQFFAEADQAQDAAAQEE